MSSEHFSNTKKKNQLSYENRRVQDAPLGTIVNFAATSFSVDEETGEILGNTARKERFALQDISRHLLTSHEKDQQKKHRIYSCCRFPTGEIAKILKSQQHDKAHFGNVMTCKSVWACPVCSAIICERRGAEVRTGCEKAREMGYKITMITLTTRHAIDDKLKTLSDGLVGAFRSFTSHRTFKKYRDAFDVLGFIKSTEITESDGNGWHPHFHIIMLSKCSLPRSFMTTDRYGRNYRHDLPELWQKCCEKAGLPIPDLIHGFKISDEQKTFDEKVADYISKFSNDTKLDMDLIRSKISNWDVAAEVSKWHSKKGRNESLTPFDFLRIYQSQIGTANPDTAMMAKYHSKFNDFVESMHGKSQIRWSRGLREALGMEEELTDEQILEQHETQSDLYACLIKSEFKQFVLKSRRSELLDTAETSTLEQFARYIYYSCYSDNSDFDGFYRDFQRRFKFADHNVAIFEEQHKNLKQSRRKQRQIKSDFAHLPIPKSATKEMRQAYADEKSEQLRMAFNIN